MPQQWYAQMRQVEYKGPRWVVELGEIVEAYEVDTMNDMLIGGELKEVWLVPVASYAPYTHLVRLRCDQTWHYLVVLA